MSDTSANGAMPPDLEPVHQRLLADSAAWSALVPSTERLRAHIQQLTRRYGNGAAGVAGVPARSPKMYAFEEEAMDDTQPETALVRTRIQPLAATTHPSWLRGLLATVAAAVVVVLLAGTFYALSARPGGIGGQRSATPLPTPGPATGVGVPGPQARFVPSAVAAHDMDATGAPLRQGGSFYPGNVVYIIARVQGVQPGETHTLTIRWYVDGRPVIYDKVAYSQAVTANGYVHFQLKLPTGAAEAKLYWDLAAADATGAEASLAQTVNFTVLPVPTVPPEPGITPTPAVSNPYIPSSTPSSSETPTPGGSATPTPSPALP